MDKPFIDKVALTYIARRRMLFGLSESIGKFINLGGKREKRVDGTWENDAEVLIREIAEETMAQVVPGSLDFVEEFRGETLDGRALHERCYIGRVAGNMDARIGGGLLGLCWLSSAHIGKNLTTPMGEKILRGFADRDLIN